MSLLTEFEIKYLIIVLLSTINPSEERSIHVLIPKSDPFLMHYNTSLKDLSVEIIKNFAEHFKYEVKYIVTDRTLTEVVNFYKFNQQFSFVQSNITQP